MLRHVGENRMTILCNYCDSELEVNENMIVCPNGCVEYHKVERK